MHPSLVVSHPDKPTEHPHTMVDVHDVVPDVERSQIIKCQLLALLNRPPDTHSVETVENLMVRVAADFIVPVDESGMNVLPGDKTRHKPAVLDQNGLQTLDLRILLTEYENLVPILHVLPDVSGEKLEVLVEHRLGSYVERNGILGVHPERNLKKNPLKPIQTTEKTSFLVHVGRIEPDNCSFGKQTGDTHVPGFRILCGKIRENLNLFPLLARQLGVAVKHMDFLNLISEERNPVRVIE